jgi:hypothetical protein
MPYRSPKTVPGNSAYNDITILSDSICSRIRINEFNYYVKNGRASMKVFPGSIPKEMLEYCIPSLRDKIPDTCVLSSGVVGKGRLNVTIWVIFCGGRAKSQIVKDGGYITLDRER